MIEFFWSVNNPEIYQELLSLSIKIEILKIAYSFWNKGSVFLKPLSCLLLFGFIEGMVNYIKFKYSFLPQLILV